ncbi:MULTISPECIES: hypothetical protein [Mycolicibacterium]|uniref:Uncharacterized protein n=1 Tax=Mycolicibacterium gilvum (strain PYR-GCK) TaxID=350054 RepID=A4T4E6_MYCGI|nr:hypothetical protein [Mycolicibacterium sp. PAM1]ABP43453.1 conserved hypothetical protein [Mycolicibacterium gilvum PYR-GCK]MBV5242292.1 hypothetical protein [Mycolicibacterium sp. PAM1]
MSTERGGGISIETVVDRMVADGCTTVLVDGRSGSGKSTLADRMQQCWPASEVVRLDDIYPGWDGLSWASEHVGSALLEPRSEGRPGRWRRWDWASDAPDGWHVVEAGRRLIVEGVGALSPANRALADLGVWVDTPDAVRKQRALTRDGDLYRPHWDRWAAQELEYIARCDPRAVADYVVTETADGLRWASMRD